MDDVRTMPGFGMFTHAHVQERSEIASRARKRIHGPWMCTQVKNENALQDVGSTRPLMVSKQAIMVCPSYH